MRLDILHKISETTQFRVDRTPQFLTAQFGAALWLVARNVTSRSVKNPILVLTAYVAFSLTFYIKCRNALSLG